MASLLSSSLVPFRLSILSLPSLLSSLPLLLPFQRTLIINISSSTVKQPGTRPDPPCLKMRLYHLFLLLAIFLGACVCSSASSPEQTSRIQLQFRDDPKNLDYKCGPRWGKCPTGTCCSSSGRLSEFHPTWGKEMRSPDTNRRLLRDEQGALPLPGLHD